MARSPTAKTSQSLETIEIFKGLSPKNLAQIQSHCSWRRYRLGESIVDYLDASSDVFFIAEGEARASIYSVLGKTVTFSDLGAGQMFGEIAAIDGTPRSAGIEAKTACIVAAMPVAAFRGLLQSEPMVAEALMRHLVAKIRALSNRVYEFSTLAVSNRIQAEVLRLARLEQRNSNSALIKTAPTHAEIASRISTHREAVTRELNRLSRIGIIERKGGGLLVKDVDRLADMVRAATGE